MKFSFHWKGSAFKCHGTGVYLIINQVSGKVYVGSAAQSIYKRCHDHRGALRYDRHKNIHLSRSWRKHGEAAFIFVVAEECDPELCVEREQHWMDRLQRKGYTLFNRVFKAGSVLGLRHSDETKEVLRQKSLEQFEDPKYREMVREFHTGRKHSEETKRKMSEAHKARYLANPETFQRWIAAGRERSLLVRRSKPRSSSANAKTSKSLQAFHNNPENRQRRLEWLRRGHLTRKARNWVERVWFVGGQNP